MLIYATLSVVKHWMYATHEHFRFCRIYTVFWAASHPVDTWESLGTFQGNKSRSKETRPEISPKWSWCFLSAAPLRGCHHRSPSAYLIWHRLIFFFFLFFFYTRCPWELRIEQLTCSTTRAPPVHQTEVLLKLIFCWQQCIDNNSCN